MKKCFARDEVSKAMSKILKNRSPKLLQLYNDKEFYNLTFNSLMSNYKIKKYSLNSTMKACIMERFNHTLKTLMYREFTYRENHKWVTILPIII